MRELMCIGNKPGHKTAVSVEKKVLTELALKSKSKLWNLNEKIIHILNAYKKPYWPKVNFLRNTYQ